MARDIDELLPQVLTNAPRCPEPLAIRHIREAARRFCKVSRIWREWDTLQVATPESEALCSIEDASIIAVESARMDERDLEPVTVGWLDSNVANWSAYDDAGQARYITALNWNTVTVVPKATGSIRLRLILEPSRQAMTLPDMLIDDFGEVIGMGAAGGVLQTPDPAIANPQLALKLQSDFDGELAKVKMRVAKGQHGAPIRTRGQFF